MRDIQRGEEMSKRFTSTEKWSDPWFRKLSPKHKCFWDWLCAQCDIAGTIDPDYDLASFQIGDVVSENDIELFGDRVSKLKNGRLFLTKFIEFQYGKLSLECNAHRPILDKIKTLQIPIEYPIYRVQEKEKEKEKESIKKEGSGEKTTHRFIKPTVQEIHAYCLERKSGINAQAFFDYYESKGWVVGKSPMKDWQAAVRTWERSIEVKKQQATTKTEGYAWA
jgi:hypothetical protein